MYCLDASALVDYLHGVEAIGAFVESHPSEPLFAPTIALQEVFVGATRTNGPAGLDALREDLGWVEALPLTVDGAAEAATVEAELHDGGQPIGPLDTLIAGVVRDVGGTLVTRDAHFERVSGLGVHRYARR